MNDSVLPKTLAVKLTKDGERSVRKRHPWIFSKSIQKLNKEGASGDIAIIFDQQTNNTIGVGLYDPMSPIRIKMLHFDGPAKIDASFFSEKIKQAFQIRKPLLQTQTNSYRLLFGENDGFPGLIADVYAHVLVIKIYSAIWKPYLKDILSLLQKTAEAETVVLRLSRNLQKDKESDFYQEGTILVGELSDPTVHFVEHGVQFSANVIQGHKTGYFLDHRHNRKRVGELSKGKTVLDIFSYAGGFSVHALAGGAKEVTSVDISEQALNLAIENGKLNPHQGVHHTIQGDAFKIMEELIHKRETFEVVIIDPPSFAKSASEIHKALHQYGVLANLGLQLTTKKGMLVLASCSSRVGATDFFDLIEKELRESGRRFQLMETTQHDIDHPISFPEGAYLKTAYYQLD